MYLIIRHTDGEVDYFGPFPSEARAMEYANSFPVDTKFIVVPVIVPNCITVKLNY